jgi:hypothetical protein
VRLPLGLSVGAVFGNSLPIRRALVVLGKHEDSVFGYGVGASLWFL